MYKAEFTQTKHGGAVRLFNEGHGSEISIMTGRGANLYSMVFEGRQFIFQKEDKGDALKYGTPLLFPCPNRVTDCTFRFEGRDYPQVKDGEPKFLHSLIYDLEFQHDEPVLAEDFAEVTCHYDNRPGNEVFDSFPFECRVSVKFRLSRRGLALGFKVQNQSGRNLPYGFAIHTWFMRETNATFIRVPADHRMLNRDGVLLPTGELAEVAGTKYDLRELTDADSVDLDDVFFGLDDSKTCEIFYKNRACRLLLNASSNMRHAVVYTPEGQPFFCLENQSCSTDAHNLYDKGLADVAGLIIVPPGGESRCDVAVVMELL